jgi:hypothetical protein
MPRQCCFSHYANQRVNHDHHFQYSNAPCPTKRAPLQRHEHRRFLRSHGPKCQCRYRWLVDESPIGQEFMHVKLGSSSRYHVDSASRSIDEGWMAIWHGKQAMTEGRWRASV